MAVGVTAAIVIGLTLFAFQTKYDFTTCGGFLCIMLLLLTVGSLIGAFFFRNELGNFIIACAGAAIFSMYIVYDTQIMMGKFILSWIFSYLLMQFFSFVMITGGEKSYSLSPEEYIFAACKFLILHVYLAKFSFNNNFHFFFSSESLHGYYSTFPLHVKNLAIFESRLKI